MKIGFLGLGMMGSGIAANLVKAGHEVTVWNRSASKARRLVAQGAAMADTPKAAASGRALVMTMLSDDAALDQVLHGSDGLLEGLDQAPCMLSTIAVSSADRMAALHADRGQRLLSAPVFGCPDAAAAAKLFVVAAGAEADFQMANALFPVISQRAFYLAETPSLANLVKLCGNFMILAAIECLAEAMTLATKGRPSEKEVPRGDDRDLVRLARLPKLRPDAGRGAL